MHAAEAGELGRLQAGNPAENANLLGMLELGLEPDQVVERAQRVVLAQLDHRMGLLRRFVRIGQPDRFQRPIGQGSRPRPAITSIGRQPSKYGVPSQSLGMCVSPASNWSMKASYCSRLIGRLT